MKYFVYILYSPSLDLFYKGHTSDPVNRLEYHNNGYEDYTAKGKPWILCWVNEKPSKSEAFLLERKLKNLSASRLMSFMLKYDNGLTPEGMAVVRAKT